MGVVVVLSMLLLIAVWEGVADAVHVRRRGKSPVEPLVGCL